MTTARGLALLTALLSACGEGPSLELPVREGPSLTLPARFGPSPAAPAELRVVQWNLENLFDWEDDPANKGDDEFTPKGSAQWTEARYRTKLAHLAATLAPLAPDLLCVEEVENRRVLDDLAAVLAKSHQWPMRVILHRDGPDPRGIDVALLARVAAEATDWLDTGFGQRETLIARFRVQGAALTVCVNHWKSQQGDAARSAATRRAQAEKVRAELDRRRATEPAAALLVAGDFNEDFDGPALVAGLRSVAEWKTVAAAAGAAGPLYNLHGELAAEERGSYYFWTERRWNSFDQISVSRALAPRADAKNGARRWRVRPGSYQVVRRGSHADDEGRPRAFRLLFQPKLGRREYQEGCSDHLPVAVTLEFAP